MNYDPLETCIYDKSHRILRSRMQYHLCRCKQNFKNSKKMTCPYNSIHIVDPIDYKHHIDNCPDKESILHFMVAETDNSVESKLLAIEPHNMDNENENWDNDNVKTYDPQIKLENSQIMRYVIGKSKKEKKKFHLNERQRIQRLENDKERQQMANEKNTPKPKNDKPLRQPRTFNLKESASSPLNTFDYSNKSVIQKEEEKVRQDIDVEETFKKMNDLNLNGEKNDENDLDNCE